MSIFKRINWTNTLFLMITPLVALIGSIYLISNHLIHWQTLVLSGVFVVFTGLSITAGYHRLFAHKSYEAKWPVKLFFALFGAAAFEGSIAEWSTDHRNHHRYTDTDKDPYDIKKGFWYAHIGWLFTLDESKRDFSNVAELLEDRIVAWQNRFFVPLAIFMGFVLPMGIASLWGDALGGLIFGGALRLVFNHHATFCINSVCHLFGKRTYSGQSARDNWFTALFTYGEGYHNFHHQFPIDYRNGIRFFDFDPTKWLIALMSFVGLASNLKTVSSERIIHYKVRMDNNRLAMFAHLSNAVKPVYEKIVHLLKLIEELEKRYSEMKKAQIKAHLVEYRSQLKSARKELKRVLSVWARLTKLGVKAQVISAN